MSKETEKQGKQGPKERLVKFLTAVGKILDRAWRVAIILFVFTLSAVLSVPLYLGLFVYEGLEHTVRTLWDTAENDGWLEAYQELLSNAKKAVQYLIKGNIND